MSIHTNAMKGKNYREWRRKTKARLYKVLCESDRPLSIGELFLMTEESHTILRKFIKEFRDEGLVYSELMDSETVLYSGERRITRGVIHWSVVPEFKSRSRRKRIKE